MRLNWSVLGHVAERGRTAPWEILHRAAPFRNVPVTFALDSTMRAVRALIFLSVLLWSSLGMVVTIGIGQGLLSASIAHPTWLTAATAICAAIAVYAWICFLALSIGWLLGRRFSNAWVWSGTGAGLLLLGFVCIPLPGAIGYALPPVIFAGWVSWFHLERVENAG